MLRWGGYGFRHQYRLHWFLLFQLKRLDKLADEHVGVLVGALLRTEYASLLQPKAVIVYMVMVRAQYCSDYADYIIRVVQNIRGATIN